jgi:type VI protein secretion system component VasF
MPTPEKGCLCSRQEARNRTSDMPNTVVESLRRQAEECLTVARASRDQAVKNELLTAAAWLFEHAEKLESILHKRSKV